MDGLYMDAEMEIDALRVEMPTCYNPKCLDHSTSGHMCNTSFSMPRSDMWTKHEDSWEELENSSALYTVFSEDSYLNQSIDMTYMDESISTFNTTSLTARTSVSTITDSDGISFKSEAMRSRPEIFRRLQRTLKNSLSKLKSTTIGYRGHPLYDSRTVSSEDVEDVWREIALCELLKVVDIPFLDSLLKELKQIRKHVRQQSEPKLVKHNTALAVGIQDFYTVSALVCISYFPKGLHSIEKDIGVKPTAAPKEYLFRVIARHYKNWSRTLLPSGFKDIHLAALKLVLEQKDELAVRVLQLEMLMLPWQVRDELQRLLTFMAATTAECKMTLSAEETNESVVLNTFTDVIIRHKCLTHGVMTLLIGLMMCHVQAIFEEPRDLQDAVATNLHRIKKGETSAPPEEKTFCRRVSNEDYERETTDCTQMALVEMVKTILRDTTLNEKKKVQMLNDFKNCHPTTYRQYFDGLF